MAGRGNRWCRLRQIALVSVVRGMGTAAGAAIVTAAVWWIQSR